MAVFNFWEKIFVLEVTYPVTFPTKSFQKYLQKIFKKKFPKMFQKKLSRNYSKKKLSKINRPKQFSKKWLHHRGPTKPRSDLCHIWPLGGTYQ